MQHGFIYKEMKSRGKDWRYSSSDRVYALQVQSPELKTSSPQKKKKKRKTKQREVENILFVERYMWLEASSIRTMINK
jgi:hypothetical protein